MGRLIVLDDATPSGLLRDNLPSEMLSNPKLLLIRNESNLGFVKTCNKGMRLAQKDDIVLLNSDTLVTRNWLVKLHAAAYSSSKVATVTPFTNNGTICSLPRFCQENEIPPGYTPDQFAALVESVAKPAYPRLPTAVGFCMYLKREVLDRIGLFDEEAFGPGYGEENDLCCRAQAQGYFDILDDATFIYHKGNQSFKEEKASLVARNTEILKRRYPHYFDKVAAFCRENPLGRVQARVMDELVRRWSGDKKLNILHILQNGPHTDRGETRGGTELHVLDLINNLPHVAHWSLVAVRGCYYLTAHMPGLEREYILDLHKTPLKSIIQPKFFPLVHLHHSRFFEHDELCRSLLAHGNYLASLHDYTLVCPRFHLLTPRLKLCNGHECLNSCGYSQTFIERYREQSARLLRSAKAVVVFSESTREYVSRIIPASLPWHKIQHGILNLSSKEKLCAMLSSPKPKPAPDSPLKVAFLGFIPPHKGCAIIEEAARKKFLGRGIPIEWHVIGKLIPRAVEGVIEHGPYERGSLYAQLKALSPHLAAVLSLCPETYGLTLDEAWNAGIPVISTPYGGVAERVQKFQAGFILEELSAEALIKKLTWLVDNWPEYEKVRARLREVQIRSLSEEASDFSKLYEHIFNECKKPPPQDKAQALEMFLGFLSSPALKHPPKDSLSKKLAKQLINKTLWLAASFRLRPWLDKAAYRLCPAKILEKIKKLRR